MRTSDGLVHWHNIGNRFAPYCASMPLITEHTEHLGVADAPPTCLFCIDKGQRDDLYGLSAACQAIIRQKRKP